MTDGAFTRCERLREAVLGCVHEGETMLAHSLGLRDQSTLDIGHIQANTAEEERKYKLRGEVRKFQPDRRESREPDKWNLRSPFC